MPTVDLRARGPLFKDLLVDSDCLRRRTVSAFFCSALTDLWRSILRTVSIVCRIPWS